jgi:hypothetical protein
MKRYGILNDNDEGDTVGNQSNAAPTHYQSSRGRRGNRSTHKQRRIRTQMNKRSRSKLKNDLIKEENEDGN